MLQRLKVSALIKPIIVDDKPTSADNKNPTYTCC